VVKLWRKVTEAVRAALVNMLAILCNWRWIRGDWCLRLTVAIQLYPAIQLLSSTGSSGAIGVI
jgi:hypothetical protein